LSQVDQMSAGTIQELGAVTRLKGDQLPRDQRAGAYRDEALCSEQCPVHEGWRRIADTVLGGRVVVVVVVVKRSLLGSA
jgi:hypothetical protein